MFKNENTPSRLRTVCGAEYEAAGQAGFQVSIPQPFRPEHFYAEDLGVYPSGLASQLNQVLAENLANNFAAKVRAAIKKGECLPTQEDMDKLYAEYNFSGTRARGSRGTSNTLFDRIFTRLAGKFIKALLKKKGYQDLKAPVTIAKKDEEPAGNQISFDVFEAEVERLVEGEGPWGEIDAYVTVREGLIEEAQEEEAVIRSREVAAESKISGLGL